MSFVRVPLLAVVLGLLALPAGAGELPERAEGIRNYKRLSPALAVGGVPEPEGLKRLREQGGLATVIDLRRPEEGTEATRTAAVGLGLRYVAVPFTPESFSSREVDAVQKVLDDPAAGPVLLYCASSNRVGGLWAAIEARRGKNLAEAIASGQQAGLRSATMIDAARRVIEADKARPKTP